MSKATILIVDDEISNIEIMNAVLEDDYEICFATSGQQALDIARTVQPDLILLDVLMPGIDGFEVCRQIKADIMLVDIPIIFTTGLGDTEDEMRGLSLGAIDYVTKPIQPAILRARVGNHVELKRLRDQLATLAVTDALTGLSNRRHMERSLQAESARLTRTGEWMSVIMLDIDFFKQFNDTYGHPAGDRCIAMVGAALTRAVKRATDLPARYGGEEFVLVLPNTSPGGARLVAEKLRQTVLGLGIPHTAPVPDSYLTVSIGLATQTPSIGSHSRQLISAADKGLYQAKNGGRNQVGIA